MDNALPVAIDTEKYHVPGGSINVPRVIGGTSTAATIQMNQMITDQINSLIKKQTSQTGNIDTMIGTYELKTNERHVLCLSFSNYTYMSHYAHGMTYMVSLTFDSQTGKSYTLKELFKPGSDYVKRISSLIQAQIRQRNIQLLNEFTAIQPDQDFYIADKSLVIYFQLYDITPYYAGFPMFPISVFDLQDMADELGPLGRMATNS